MCANKKIHREHMFKLISVNIKSILKLTFIFYRIINVLNIKEVQNMEYPCFVITILYVLFNNLFWRSCNVLKG